MMNTFDRDSISWLNIDVNGTRLLSKIEVNRRSTYQIKPINPCQAQMLIEEYWHKIKILWSNIKKPKTYSLEYFSSSSLYCWCSTWRPGTTVLWSKKINTLIFYQTDHFYFQWKLIFEKMPWTYIPCFHHILTES